MIFEARLRDEIPDDEIWPCDLVPKRFWSRPGSAQSGS